ncbi:SdrD B-like domain-containing protein [Humisphaera borealis]|uniref:DUF3494 domain-containing protein n=1 Tax=Humisphaera borealis TaxID=2807512 RepID=A0A7M2WU26_9BACT|nr:SdrD B-like domain-containing protein [Humisphaera borealis]QOV89027.1 DUF3494 domain-containing protein [Humisphaera borealis]
MSFLSAAAAIYQCRSRVLPARKPSRLIRRVAREQVERLEDRRLLSAAAVLGTAESFAALAGASVTNTGPTVLQGDLGVSPGNAITGFPPGIVNAPGTIHTTDAVAAQAEADALTAYNNLAGLATTATLTGQDLGGMTLVSGVYTFSSSAQLTGTITLDAQNNANAKFVFQIGSTLTTASASKVNVINAPPCFDDVYWQVGSSATLGSTTEFYGSIIALTSITLVTGASIVQGNALALNGSVTLDNNTISPDQCGTISGVKFDDTNGDGIRQPGEPGVTGVTIFLDSNGDNLLSSGEASTTTIAGGAYHFDDVVPGAYSVREVVPPGSIRTTVNPAAVTVPNRSDAPGGDFGNFRLGQIGGTTFDDVDGDGTQDAGDAGTPGVTVYIDTNGNNALDGGESSTTSGPGGTYTLTGVGPGPITVREVAPTDTTQTTTNPAPITTISGGSVPGIDFGNTPVPPTVPPVPPAVPGQITGIKFRDSDGDGIRQTGEPGLPGVALYIDTDGNGAYNDCDPCVITDANGTYVFTNVAPGSYVVREQVPAGWVQTTTNPGAVTVAGNVVSGGNFGNFQLGCLIGIKFQDTNGNGIRDSADPALARFTIYIDANGNNTLDSGERNTTTDADGTFAFSNVGPGTFRIREVVPSGWTQTTANPSPIVMTSGANVTSIRFGNRLTAVKQISGAKFQDTNGDGIRQAGEPGVASVTLYLDVNGNGQRDNGELSTLTDATGAYGFTNVTPGTYKVREAVPAGWVQTTANPAAVNVTATGTVVGGIFGDFQLGTIGGTKFQDTNGNAIRDSGEPGLAGVTIFIDSNLNGALNTGERYTKSDGNGTFSFANVGPGRYSIREVKPNGWTQTTANPAAILMTSGASILSVRFGNKPVAVRQVSGIKFNDYNGDGIRQSGEAGLSGVTLYLDANGNNLKDTGEITTLTDASGGYAFVNVAAGTYSVREVAPTGWIRTTANPGAIVVALAGGTIAGGTFGNFKLGSVAGKVTQDICDCPDVLPSAFGGVTVKLYRDVNGNGLIDAADGASSKSTVSAANGTYSFGSLTAGKYIVKATTAAGYTASGPTVYAINVSSGSLLTSRNFLQATVH